MGARGGGEEQGHASGVELRGGIRHGQGRRRLSLFSTTAALLTVLFGLFGQSGGATSVERGGGAVEPRRLLKRGQRMQLASGMEGASSKTGLSLTFFRWCSRAR